MPQVEGMQAEIIDQPITQTLEKNFMPYAMSVIVSRAIPELDGFKPSHRKLLYTMYKQGLLSGARTKSANIVGETMKLNPHGDGAIYETMVRLSRGYGALLHPLVDSKGNFGKVYSRDMAYAASRYTEAKLDGICSEIFGDIDKGTVDFVDSYDHKTKEPTLLPTTFPNILVSANQGIAVGMASMMCGFNLREVCETTVAYLKNPSHDLLSTLPAPDFPTGGEIIYDPVAMREIYETGRGSFKVRARWHYDKKNNTVEITELPYTTTIEAVIDKIADLIKQGKLREVSDTRDETDLSGLKIAIELKRGVDSDKLMAKLFKLTTLRDSFACNFNVLVNGMPQVLGVGGLLREWSAWRMECVRKRVTHELGVKQRKLHLLKGLAAILLDIDKAINIIRNTREEDEVVPNLMIGFGIDVEQAEFVAEIKLRNINRAYIVRRAEEIEVLQIAVADLQAILADEKRIRKIIIEELMAVAKKYGRDRLTGMTEETELAEEEVIIEVEDYPVHVFVSKEGYFKKITPLSLRMSGEQKYKEGDGLAMTATASNREEILVFTDKAQVYKSRLSDFSDAKASVLGDYLPTKLQMEDGESVLAVVLPRDYSKWLLILFDNGKCARIAMNAYDTKQNRKKLTGAYHEKSLPVAFLPLDEECELVAMSTEGRAIAFQSASLAPKATRSTQGVGVLTVKTKYKAASVVRAEDAGITNIARHRVRSLPAAGLLVRAEDRGEVQVTMEG
ncbi:MAG: topoisomerase IV [Oscillospiraceae bacterium]|nr:topoisomerase IV [Oscillospiraceae bacterium]